MTESKQKAVELVKNFTKLEDAILCVEEILQTCVESRIYFWQEVLTHLKEML